MNNLKTIPHFRTEHSQRLTLVLRICLGLASVIWMALVLAATMAYSGNRFEFLVFALLFMVMVALAIPRPRLYGYTLLAAFLFLGFCAKSVAYLALGIALVEPTGGFDGSGHAWDSALLPAIAGSAGVITIRVVHLATRMSERKADSPFGLRPPAWYQWMRIPVLAASFAGFVVLNGLNLVLALYQIGVIPKLVLPAHLSVVVEWLFVAGLAMWAATLIGWEAQVRSSRLGSLFLIPFGEALASVSTLSRSSYLFRAISYLLVAAEFPGFFRARLTRRWRVLFLVIVPVGLAIAIAGVSLLRISVYPVDSAQTPAIAGASPGASTGSTSSPPAIGNPTPVAQGTRLQFAVREVGLLIVGRWIGIEGTMAVSSHPGLGVDTLRRALTESPSVGEASFYQHLSGSAYHTTGQYEFLTTPGAIAILDYSGSLAVVATGMGLITALLIAFEMAASRLLGNALTVSIVAMTLANAAVQMQFPYLFFVFLVEQAVALLALGLISRGIWRDGAGVHKTAMRALELSDGSGVD
jgi:hypothetical protein